jgi:hypothetical protein
MLLPVWFIYPETANVRLEDMNSLFGDATSVMPTPETHAALSEAESLLSGGRSPVPDLDIGNRSGNITADHAIPGLDIDPPINVGASSDQRGSATLPRPNLGHRTASGRSGEGVGGWISSMVARTRAGGDSNSERSEYKRVGQNEDE